MRVPYELREAVRRHVARQWPPAPAGHYEACLADLIREPREAREAWSAYFLGVAPFDEGAQ